MKTRKKEIVTTAVMVNCAMIIAGAIVCMSFPVTACLVAIPSALISSFTGWNPLLVTVVVALSASAILWIVARILARRSGMLDR
ncbi:MAG: hypothetical protein V4664_01700 [Patescibacteria group bacterium]